MTYLLKVFFPSIKPWHTPYWQVKSGRSIRFMSDSKYKNFDKFINASLQNDLWPERKPDRPVWPSKHNMRWNSRAPRPEPSINYNCHWAELSQLLYCVSYIVNFRSWKKNYNSVLLKRTQKTLGSLFFKPSRSFSTCVYSFVSLVWIIC